ncbi:MAG: hypothetical protein ACP5OA_03775 [Candidatus Woesearchaeota archaeon]
MRNTQDMLSLKSSPRYKAAKTIFDDILNKRQPDFDALVSLHGEKVAKTVEKSILRFYNDPLFTGGEVRLHDSKAPNILSDMRKFIDEDEDFRNIDEYFVSQTCRDEELNVLVSEIESEFYDAFKRKFGPYANSAIMAAAIATKCHLKRKSDVSAVSHWTGAAGIMYFLQKQGYIAHYSDEYFRVIVAFLHDFNEDLPRKVLHADGKVYGLYRTEEFGRDYLPDNALIIRDVNILTNLYSEVTKHAFDVFMKRGQAFTYDGFKSFLIELMELEKYHNDSMYEVHKTLFGLVSARNYGNIVGKDLLSAISWDSYNFYIHKIISESEKFNDDTPIIAKFCDQNYNFIGKEILASPDLIKNLLKVWLWATEVDKNPNIASHMKNFVRELLEDDLSYAEYYIVRDLMRRESILTYYAGAYEKIKKLMPILYTNKNIRD